MLDITWISVPPTRRAVSSTTGGIALTGGLGVFNFANDEVQYYGDWVAFVESDCACVFHAVNDEFQRIADVVGFDFRIGWILRPAKTYTGSTGSSYKYRFCRTG